jgi:hypothetical protein
VVAPRLVCSELLDPHRAPGLGAFCMCCMMLASWPLSPVSGQETGLVCLSVAAIAALTVTSCHLWQSHRRALPLEPSNFPANVSVGLVPIIGAQVGMPSAVRDAFFWLGIVLATLITPKVVRHLCRSPRLVANPSVWPLSAPWALLSAAWHASDGGARTPEAFGYALGIVAFTMLLLTAAFAAVRARAIASTYFSPPWAMFTFPTCTNAVSLLRCAGRTGSTALLIAAVALSLAAAAIVLAVFGLTLCHLPGWLAPPAALSSSDGAAANHTEDPVEGGDEWDATRRHHRHRGGPVREVDEVVCTPAGVLECTSSTLHVEDRAGGDRNQPHPG